MKDKSFFKKTLKNLASSLDIIDETIPHDYFPQAYPSLIKEGYCEKRSLSNPVGNFRRRFFLLEKEENLVHLSYSKTFYQKGHVERNFYFSPDTYITDFEEKENSLKINRLVNDENQEVVNLILSFPAFEFQSWKRSFQAGVNFVHGEEEKNGRVYKEAAASGRFFEAVVFKKNQNDDRWMQRWCSLEGSGLYYRETPDSEVSGQVELLGKEIKVGRKVLKEVKSAPTKYLIKIKDKKKDVKLLLACRNEENYLVFLQAIRQNILATEIGKRASLDLKGKRVNLDYEEARANLETVSL
eukprot:snap_masked-scaffold_2-processed-gene-11.9-mRNA-1 protein AED:1.00 eAED:1.00 QI:0/-1/0/0/-1/1/1/0/297